MEANKVLESTYLDILFENRNKAYGAYALRKGYTSRMLWSLLAMSLTTGGLFGISYFSNRGEGPKKQAYSVVDVQLEEVQQEKKIETPPPTPPPPQAPLKIEMTKFTAPKIVKDNEVKEEEKPPEQEKLADTKIGLVNQEGVKDEGVVAPPVSTGAGTGVVEAPKPKYVEDYDKTFTKVEIESEYPGGQPAWLRYLNKNFRYPQDALNNEIQGTVVVQFIVDKDGNVSDVQAVNGPETGGLRDEAIRVIQRSGKWIPAIQNGRTVKSYKKQPVIFKLVAS